MAHSIAVSFTKRKDAYVQYHKRKGKWRRVQNLFAKSMCRKNVIYKHQKN